MVFIKRVGIDEYVYGFGVVKILVRWLLGWLVVCVVLGLVYDCDLWE